MMKKLTFLFFIFCILQGCEENYINEGVDDASLPDEIELSNKGWDELVEIVAVDVSDKLNGAAFRTMLKHEVMMQFDGDYNILISSMLQRRPKYLAFEEAQSQVMNTTNEDLLANYDWDVLEAAAESYPLMQIAVQVDAENWDADNVIPSVVYVTSDFDEATHNSVDGFDKDQNPITVSTLEDPVENYVVISHNERTYEENETVYYNNTLIRVPCCIESAPYDPNDPSSNPPELCMECSDVPVPPSDGGDDGPPSYVQYIGTGHNGTLPSLIHTFVGTSSNQTDELITQRINPLGTINGATYYRANYEYERIRQMRCDNINQIEGWPAGKLELRVHVMEQDQDNPASNLLVFKEEFRPKRNEIKNKWYNNEQATMHLWDWENTGTRMTYGFYEYDRPFLGDSEIPKSVGDITQQILDITGIIGDTTVTAVIGDAINVVGRGLIMENNSSEYIGYDDISIFNDLDQFPHPVGGFKYKTWPDLP